MRQLVEWKGREDRKSLFLFGARQVGSSYLIEQFARQNFESYVLLNLEEDPRLARAFDGSLEPRNVISNLSQITGVTLDI